MVLELVFIVWNSLLPPLSCLKQLTVIGSVGDRCNVEKRSRSVNLNSVTVNPVKLPEQFILLKGIVVKCLLDTGAGCA